MANKDRCPKCGALVLPEERFCARCGAPLTEDGETAAREPRADFPEEIVLNRRGAAADIVGETAPEVPRADFPEEIVLNRRGAAADIVETLPELGAAAAVAQSLPEDAAGTGAYTGGVPATIEQLKGFCAVNEMPLEKMRFFIDQDYRQPRAFGIYRDGDEFVVYKNKDNGSRAVRYHGPDEAYAVKELYEKLLSECHNRGIYPDGAPESAVRGQRRPARRSSSRLILIVILVIVIAAGVLFFSMRTHRYDGYYTFDDGSYYYRYGDSWYYNDYYGWSEVDDFPYYFDDYGDYYLGDDYDSDWNVEDFRQSDTWESIQESHTSSSDFDSWDSGDTDWSSDW